MTIYRDYSRAKVGWFFGLSGLQLCTLAASALPVFWAIHSQAWTDVLALLIVWLVVLTLVVVPIRGRSATGWLLSTNRFTIGTVTGRTRFRSRAATGRPTVAGHPDLPGVLGSVEVHEGPPTGPAQARIALIQNHAARTWAITASVVHPGIGMTDTDDRRRLGAGLTELLDLCSRTELVDELLFMVRTVPDDGAERAQWMARHRRADSPALSRHVNDDLHQILASASVRAETFVSIVVPEARIARAAKEAGGGLAGRARILYQLAGEIEAHLRGAVAMTEVTWLTSPDLATACRTGFAPADRAGIVDAHAASQAGGDVPWELAGPSGADTLVRHYAHDAWNSVSATVRLPVKGAVMGALAPILTPNQPGERRSFVVAFPVLRQSMADRQSASSEWAADLGDALREKAKVKQRTRSRDEADKVRALDRKLARGNSMTQPYAVATVTVPNTARIAEFGRSLDASIRRAGFAPLRLDLSQDVAFACSSVPLGISLTRGTG